MATLQKHVSKVKVDPKLGARKNGKATGKKRPAPPKKSAEPNVQWFETEFQILHDKDRRTCFRGSMTREGQQLMVGHDLWILKSLFNGREPAEGEIIKVRIGVRKE